MSLSPPVGDLPAPRPVEITTEWDAGLSAGNPLDFPGYEVWSGGSEAVRTGVGYVDGVRCAVVDSDYSVFGGSMGLAVGEKVSRAFRRAAAERLPIVAFVRTGGARMQEGMLSLVQMPRVVGAIREHAACGEISVGLLQSPTTGGVFASWASLLDLRAAESGATIGFAGPRVVAEMTGSYPPADSHNAESAYTAGLVDVVVGPGMFGPWLRGVLGREQVGLSLPAGRSRPGRAVEVGAEIPLVHPGDPRAGAADAAVIETVREISRPSGLEWAAALCESWIEIKGADPSMRAAVATVRGVRCIAIAMDRHANADGAARQSPAGYRLAQRAVELAEKLSLPVLTLVDTPGADPSPESEGGGIAREIARTLWSFDQLTTGSVSVCVGEGGSGGAIALAHTDLMFMLEDSVFSVIGPEAAAVILWHDVSRAREATSALRIDAGALLDLGVCDRVLSSDTSTQSLWKTRSTVATALLEAKPGRRHRRIDLATDRWLVSSVDGA
ncbi:hypothetical protein CH282_25920 [Rhodococcus sp. 06-418-1B]|nr:carboxyl transferase domain-containing protein [Rhodococcus sp. 06-418-1B]OZC76323.1 hypothetical protein CH282_25920 [Rhodococcus sp. 06-418-1B]